MTSAICNDVRKWLLEDALPFWADKGVDRVHGGYVEQLRLDGTDPAVGFKRTRVIGRQIYSFCHASLLGRGDGVALARHGYEFLTANAWLGPERGWARRLDREGRVTDPTPDLYDLAFILFALGWYHRVTGDPGALSWALRTVEFLESQMRHPSGIGFLNEKPATRPRLQNPHMHLLEAALVNLEHRATRALRRWPRRWWSCSPPACSIPSRRRWRNTTRKTGRALWASKAA
jgi:mannose/cellobiose epimerase-like protein (N-acyl-D-glucosamine 2-epimerase family)